MGTENRVDINSLIKDELDGKGNAIAHYDEMLWKIRSGYAMFLYGSIGLIVGLVGEKVLTANSSTINSIGILIFGFSAFAAFLDYSFMASKLRVVNYRDRLSELAFFKVNAGKWEASFDNELLECLKNSGERRDKVNWSQRTGFWRPVILYGGTCTVCIAATQLLDLG
jgi:hypothetical protein